MDEFDLGVIFGACAVGAFVIILFIVLQYL